MGENPAQRKGGYYWVKRADDQPWEPAEFVADPWYGEWLLMGYDCEVPESRLYEIGPKIEPPE